MTATRISPAPLHPAARSHPARPEAAPTRQTLLHLATELQERARCSAEAGDIAVAAQAILQSLDYERRAGGLGPQVLQLIKPR